MIKINKIILASKSKARYNLLVNLGINAEILKVFPTGADESLEGGILPKDAVIELSLRKSQIVFDDLKNLNDFNSSSDLIIAADTVVVHNGKILGKPSDEADAFKTLSALSGSNHEVYSGISLILDGKILYDYDVTKVRFREIDPKEIDVYIKTGDSLSKAGSYGAEGMGSAFIEKIEGDFFNIVGLPVNKFVNMLKTGWDLTVFDLIF